MDDVDLFGDTGRWLPLKNGGGALVDPEDRERFLPFTWRLGTNGYVSRSEGEETTIYLHREVLDLEPGDGVVVDHINGNKLDNRKANLHAGTQADNQQNQRPRTGTSSKFRGVSLNKATGRWEAYARVDGQRFHLGHFSSERDAAATAGYFRALRMPHSAEGRLYRQLSDEWLEVVQDAYRVAKAERMHELRGKYVSRFDLRGVHLFSEACGRVELLAHLCPDLQGDFSARELRDAAKEDAEKEFRREMVLGSVVTGEFKELGLVLQGAEAPV